jgi:hypothetical protein
LIEEKGTGLIYTNLYEHRSPTVTAPINFAGQIVNGQFQARLKMFSETGGVKLTKDSADSSLLKRTNLHTEKSEPVRNEKEAGTLFPLP